MENLNLVELLRDCPAGMELDCTMFENLEFDYIDKDTEKYPIICRVKTEWGSYDIHTFTKYGCFTTEKYSKCSIFPKGKTTWEGFQRPFKDGDIVTWEDRGSLVAFIYKERKDVALVKHHFALYTGSLGIVINGEISLVESEIVFATEEEKQKLFDAIKANGYRWNSETKTLEKLVVPKFKVGDKIGKCGYRFTIKEVREYHYLTKCGNKIPIDNQDDFSLVPNKFDITTLKPFDKVLVRNTNTEYWHISLFGVIVHNDRQYFMCLANSGFYQCIPYEGNEHLLGTANDCDDFYKTWEK